MSSCFQKFEERWKKGLFVCVGLDPRPSQIPASITGDTPVDRVVSFCQFIVEATTNHALAFKINTAFFEGLGASGIEALYRIRASMLESSPEVPLILDYKRGDIGDTNEAYAQFAESLQADAVTINPYLGMNANIPWLKRTKLGVFVLCRTSNPGSDEFQERRVFLDGDDIDWLEASGNIGMIDDGRPVHNLPLYQHVALRVANRWNSGGNCGLVTGATYPRDIAAVRRLVGPRFPLLLPGIGAQGGDLEAAVRAGAGADASWFIVNSSRGIIHASSNDDFAHEAIQALRTLNEAICKIRESILS